MRHPIQAAVLLLGIVAAGAINRVDGQVTTSKGDVRLDKVDADKLRIGMRDLWADHVIWTREVIVNAIEADEPSASAATDRLMKNQEDIGNAIVPYYGREAGTKLTGLLKDHIRIATEVVGAAKAKDNTKLADADKRWKANATDIATFLSGANPNWPKADLEKMLYEHLSLTTREATARLEKDWTKDVEAFDRIYDQAMHMADALTAGIVKQFANK